MGMKKKRNIIYLTLCAVTSFILYQLYFFVAISSESTNSVQFNPIVNSKHIEERVHIRTDADKYVNEGGKFRGVSRQNMLKYRPDSNYEFKCLNSEDRIPFDSVNDDYCDCEDGTDEPSTTACPKGVFYCDLEQKKPITIQTVPSSRVNDGICDCCDGSDEWIIDTNKKLLTQSSNKGFRDYATSCSYVC